MTMLIVIAWIALIVGAYGQCKEPFNPVDAKYLKKIRNIGTLISSVATLAAVTIFIFE